MTKVQLPVPLFLLAGMVALLLGGAPLAQTPEPAQDDSIEVARTGDAVCPISDDET